MYSLAFPDMISSSKINIISDKDATKSNLYLLLKSSIKGLYGDPYFGTELKKTFFFQNGSILKDLVIDEIYTSIQEFMPQISLTRDNITVTQEKECIVVKIECLNLIDYTTDLYSIRLITTD